MKNMHKKVIAGNWKMNGGFAAARALTQAVLEGVAKEPTLLDRCNFIICPPFLHLQTVRAAIDHAHGPVLLGAQDCSDQDNGAFTGDISAAMLKDGGVGAAILGHSERRQGHKEDNALVAAKAVKAHEAGLLAIICVGEVEAEREAGRHFDVVAEQLAGSLPAGATLENTIIAYEPVWAIGTGKTATPDDVAKMHAFIREKVGNLRILYGGSVKPENAAALFSTENVDGALIGGASLKADQYLGIAKAA